MSKEQIEKERWDIAKIMADNFHINGEGWSESDFEWTAHCLQMAGYRKQSKGVWVKLLDEYDCEYAKCSCCGEEFYDASGEDTIDMFYKFCPNCGAKMKGE